MVLFKTMFPINTKKMIVYNTFFLLVFLSIAPVMAADNNTDEKKEIMSEVPNNFIIYPNKIKIEIADKITKNEIISKEIAKRERLLSEGLLKINDFNATKLKMTEFLIRPNDNLFFSNDSYDSNTYSESEIQENSIPNFGYDGKIRLFTSEGVQLSQSDDCGTGDLLKNSNKLSSSKFSISVPSGSTIQNVGKNTYVIYKNKIVLTIVDDGYDKKSKSASIKCEEVTTLEKKSSLSPNANGDSWVAWVQYNLGLTHLVSTERSKN